VLLAVLLAAAGCGHGRTLVVDNAELLENPYPLDYPSTAPLPNRRLAELTHTKVCVLDDTYGKDFHVFRVRTSAGQQGYILDDPGVRVTREPCR
jgi:hypothetical protein